jgi:hypothetical protein
VTKKLHIWDCHIQAFLLLNKDLFALGAETVDLIDRLAKGTRMANVKIRDNIDAKTTVDAYWEPWLRRPPSQGTTRR